MSTKIYTKTGDDGTTGLFGGQRVKKYSARIDAYGTVDELNCVIGIALAQNDLPQSMKSVLTEISALLFTVGADLATPLERDTKYHIPRVEEKHTKWLEEIIDSYSYDLPALKTFILPGGTKAASYLHLARTVCRRAERLCVELAENEDIGVAVIPFLNRLSDFLFTAARMANFLDGTDDIPWKPHH